MNACHIFATLVTILTLVTKVVSNIWIIVHFIYGMSSLPLTNSIIFQDGHIAPPTRVTLW